MYLVYEEWFSKKHTRCSISPNSPYWFLWHHLLPSLFLLLMHFCFFQAHKELFLLQNRTKKFSFPISNFVFFCNCKKKLLKNQYIVAKSYTIGNGASLVNKGNCNFFPLFGHPLVHSRWLPICVVLLLCSPTPSILPSSPKIYKLISEMKREVWKELFLQSKFLMS